MVGHARLLILLPLETKQVTPDNTVVLMLKPGDQTYSHLTPLTIVVSDTPYFSDALTFAQF